MRKDYYLATSDAKGTIRLFDCVDLNQAKAKATKHAKKNCKSGAEIMLFDEHKNLLVTKSNYTYSKWSSNGLEPIIDYDLEKDIEACEKSLTAVEPLVIEPENMEVKIDKMEVKNLASKKKAKAKPGKIGRPKKEPTKVMRVPEAISEHIEQLIKDYKNGYWTPEESIHWINKPKSERDI